MRMRAYSSTSRRVVLEEAAQEFAKWFYKGRWFIEEVDGELYLVGTSDLSLYGCADRENVLLELDPYVRFDEVRVTGEPIAMRGSESNDPQETTARWKRNGARLFPLSKHPCTASAIIVVVNDAPVDWRHSVGFVIDEQKLHRPPGVPEFMAPVSRNLFTAPATFKSMKYGF